MTCPSTWANVPVWMNVNRLVNTSSSGIAITISGVTSGKSMMKLDTPEPAPTPAGKAKRQEDAERRGDHDVERRELEALGERPESVGSLMMELGSLMYQRVEKRPRSCASGCR